MTTYETAHKILAELDQIMSRVDESQVDAFCESVLGARRILAYALGRELLTLRSFAMRMMHIGFDVHMVGDVTAPPLGSEDVLLMICGPGYIYTTEALMKIAEKVGGKVVMVTAQPQAVLPQKADVVLHIYNPSGALVRDLSLGGHPAGDLRFSWDGMTAAGTYAPAGTYYVQAGARDLDDGGRALRS